MGFFDAIKSGVRSFAGGIFDGIGLGAPPPSASGGSSGAFNLAVTGGVPSFLPGAATPGINPNVRPPLLAAGRPPAARVGEPGRLESILSDIGSGLGGLALDAGTGFLATLVPTVAVTGRGVKVRMQQAPPQVAASTTTRTRVRENPAVQSGVVSEAGMGGALIAGARGLAGSPLVQGAIGGALGALAFGGDEGGATALPGGAMIARPGGAQSGIFRPTAGMRANPIKMFHVVNPVSGNLVFYHRVVPTGFRLVGRRRRPR